MEETLINQADCYGVQNCPIHPDEKLNTLCIDTNCPNFFQPSCYECARSRHNHLIQTMVRLKSCLKQISENVKDCQFHELETTDKVIFKALINMAKEYKTIGERIINLSDTMKEEAEILAKVQSPFYYKCKASTFLGIIFENQEKIENLYKSLAQLKQVLEFNGDQIRFKKPQFTQQKKNLQMQLYTHRIKQNMYKFNDCIYDCQRIEFQDLNYTFQKTVFNDSWHIHEVLLGIEYHGEPKCQSSQVLCSTMSMFKGRHGIVIKIIERCKNYDTFLNVGFMVEDKINTDYPKNGPYGAGICIFTGTRPIQMKHTSGPEDFECRTGDLIKAEIFFEQKNFVITNLRNKQTYSFEDKEDGFQFKDDSELNERVRFRISFNGANSTKLALVESY